MSSLDRKRMGKFVSDSAIEQRIGDLFSQPHEVFFGGRLLQIVNKIASSVATYHAEMPCEMVGMDCVRFFSPVKKGDLLTCLSSVNKAWSSSLEVGVSVIAEDCYATVPRKILSAYFIFECFDEEKKTVKIPFVIPETQEERNRYITAEKRKILRQKNIVLKSLKN